MIEVVVAMAVFLTGTLTITLLLVRAHSLRNMTEERQVARNALNAIAEQARAVSKSSQDAADGWAQAVVNAYQLGGAPGGELPVDGLDPIAGFPTVAIVQVITDETLTDQDLGVSLGMPRDLDGDGLATNGDVTATALLLPVVVTLQWSGASGDGSLVHGIYIQSF